MSLARTGETKMTATRTTKYVVVDAPGYYGDRTSIMSAHVTLEAAKRAAKSIGHHRYAVYECSLPKRSTWFRASESQFPRVA